MRTVSLICSISSTRASARYIFVSTEPFSLSFLITFNVPLLQAVGAESEKSGQTSLRGH